MHGTAAARYLTDPDLEFRARGWICLITRDFSGDLDSRQSLVTISSTVLLSLVRFCANGPFASACLVTVLSSCLPSRSSLNLLLLDTRYLAQDTGVRKLSDTQAWWWAHINHCYMLRCTSEHSSRHLTKGSHTPPLNVKY